MNTIAIILASGKGERTGENIPKQFIKIAGKTVLEHSVEAFEKNNNINEIIIVTNPDYIEETKNLTAKNNFKKIKKIVSGGKTRQESSFIGINSIEEDNAKVLIHDAARPFISEEVINECITKLDTYKAIGVVIDSADTLAKINDKNIIEAIPERKYYKRVQTPQAFDLKTIKTAHQLALKERDVKATDDCGLVLKFKLCDVYTIKGSEFNYKITYPIDVAIAEILFKLKNN